MHDNSPDLFRKVKELFFKKNSKGQIIEFYLAEEAIGLAKSLDWDIIPGPFNKTEDIGDGK